MIFITTPSSVKSTRSKADKTSIIFMLSGFPKRSYSVIILRRSAMKVNLRLLSSNRRKASAKKVEKSHAHLRLLSRSPLTTIASPTTSTMVTRANPATHCLVSIRLIPQVRICPKTSNLRKVSEIGPSRDSRPT